MSNETVEFLGMVDDPHTWERIFQLVREGKLDPSLPFTTEQWGDVITISDEKRGE